MNKKKKKVLPLPPTKDNSWPDFLRNTTLSSSGWRRIFNPEGDAESLSKNLDSSHKYFVALATEVIAGYFKQIKGNPRIAIAQDSRPSGKAILQIIQKVLNQEKLDFWNFGITALPHCSATVKAKPELFGFIYVTASHNPPGYNGIKIGNRRGEVISSKINARLVSKLEKKLLHSNTASLKELPTPPVKVITAKEEYRNSLLDNLGYRDKQIRTCFDRMVKNISSPPPHRSGISYKYAIGCDFNGSSRIHSLDREFITDLGIEFLSINSEVGSFAHEIVPEQESLEPLKAQMGATQGQGQGRYHWGKHPLLFSYAVDCDGDRGNIVVNTLGKGRGRVNPVAPDAQTTFALTVLSELCYLQAFFPSRLKKTIIVANDPTSLRIDALAEKFGAKVARAEVGEANVVSLARELRRKGYFTPVMGEGSNGGSIIHPGVIRDPLTMVISLIKLLFLDNGKTSLRNIAVDHLGCPDRILRVPPEFFLGEVIPYIHTHHSTSVFNPSSLIKTKYSSQKKFKKIFEELWKKSWVKEKSLFKSWGVADFQIYNYEGTQIHPGAGNRHGREDGGHKISLYDRSGKEVGFLWFRFSKTEPVLRLSGEHQNLGTQKKLFTFQRKLLLQTSLKDHQT